MPVSIYHEETGALMNTIRQLEKEKAALTSTIAGVTKRHNEVMSALAAVVQAAGGSVFVPYSVAEKVGTDTEIVYFEDKENSGFRFTIRPVEEKIPLSEDQFLPFLEKNTPKSKGPTITANAQAPQKKKRGRRKKATA